MTRRAIFTFLILFLALSGIAFFLTENYQKKSAAEISAILNSPDEKTAGFTQENQLSESEQIAQLRQEIENLKRQVQSSKFNINQSSSPLAFKTQEELDRAKNQISSLSQELAQLKEAKGQLPLQPTTDADLLKSWGASEKVVQVACQDNFSKSWQLGSGVLISNDGKVLTNQHVVQSSIKTTPDYCLILFSKDYDAPTKSYKREFRATVSNFFDGLDAALLQIQDVVFRDSAGNIQTVGAANTLSYFKISPSAPQIGDSIYVIGFPESADFAFSVTKGIISNLGADGVYFGTDAQIDRGNSGGAALNSSGQLIGLPTYKFVLAGDYRGYILNIQQIKL